MHFFFLYSSKERQREKFRFVLKTFSTCLSESLDFFWNLWFATWCSQEEMENQTGGLVKIRGILWKTVAIGALVVKLQWKTFRIFCSIYSLIPKLSRWVHFGKVTSCFIIYAFSMKHLLWAVGVVGKSNLCWDNLNIASNTKQAVLSRWEKIATFPPNHTDIPTAFFFSWVGSETETWKLCMDF